MSAQGSIAALGTEISTLAAAFDHLVAQVAEKVTSLGEDARKGAEERLESARDDALEQASVQAARLRRIIAEYEGIDATLAVLEQLHGITAHLKQVVKGLEQATSSGPQSRP